MTDVIVAGAGLAGLTAAKHLAADGRRVRVFEAADQVGGRVRSDRVDGFTLDRGFQVLFTAYPAVRQELDLEGLDLRPFRPGTVLARPGERTTLSDPLRDPTAFVASALNRDVTVGDKLRTLKLRRRLTRKSLGEIMDADDTTIEESLRRRGFSERFRRRFAAPFYGGVTLDRSLSSSRLVFEYTFKMLSEGDIVVPAEGMGAITQQLAKKAREAGARIDTGRPVDSVSTDGDGVVVGTNAGSFTADAAIVATDPESASALTGCDGIPTDGDGCVTQHFSLPAGEKLDTDRRLILNTADDRPNTVAPISEVAPACAPAGKQLLSATFLGTPAQSDAELAATVRETVGSWYPAHSFAELELLETHRIPFAQFAQPPGFRETLPAVDDPEGAVYLAGEYTEWSSIQGAMVSGRNAARTLRRQQRG